MITLAPISDKLAILIPRLGSDRDGEIVATAKAIGRQLSKNGSDWHDLAARLTILAPVGRPEAAPGFSGIRSYRAAVSWIIANEDGALSDKEHEFITNMQRTLIRRSQPTPKQAKWIDDILERQGGYWK